MPIPIRIRYKEHIATAKFGLGIKYRCSHCGKDVFTTHQVEVKESKNTSVDNDGAKFSEALKERASKNLQKKLDRIIEEYKQEKYDTANFNIKCPYCNNKEPWSQLGGMSCGGCLARMLSALCVFLGLSSFSKPLQAITFVGIGIGIWAVCKFVSSQIYKHKYKKIAMLPKESLPRICINSNKTTSPEPSRTPTFRELRNVREIYSSGQHTPGCEYTEISVGQFTHKYFYVYSQMTDRMNAGSYTRQVPEQFVTNGVLDEEGLLNYLGFYNETREKQFKCTKCNKIFDRKYLHSRQICVDCFSKTYSSKEGR